MFKLMPVLIILCDYVLVSNSLTAIEKTEDIRRARETLLLFKMFPKAIPHFPVRVDSRKEQVSRGRLELLHKYKKVPLKYFKDVKQCDDNESALDQYYVTLEVSISSDQ